MYVTECDVPASSVLDRALVGNSDYHDSYSVRLSHLELEAPTASEVLHIEIKDHCRR